MDSLTVTREQFRLAKKDELEYLAQAFGNVSGSYTTETINPTAVTLQGTPTLATAAEPAAADSSLRLVNTRWVKQNAASTGTTAPTAPVRGQVWIDTSQDPPVMSIWDDTPPPGAWVPASGGRFVNVTGDTMTGNLTVPSLNDGPLAGCRNQLINGDMRVWQRGFTFAAGGDKYTADRWSVNTGLGVTRGTHGAFPGMFSLDATGNGFLIQMVEMEGAGAYPFLPNSTWTLTFHATVQPAGIFVRWRDSAQSTTNEVAVASPGSWPITSSSGIQRYQSTFTIPAGVVPVGTNKGLAVIFQFTADTNISAIQLEPGPDATPFEHRPIGTELALCQRYYQASDTGIADLKRVFNFGAVQSNICVSADFPVTMRAVPTIAVVGDINDGAPIALGAAGASPSRNGFTVYAAVPANQHLDMHHYTAAAEL